MSNSFLNRRCFTTDSYLISSDSKWNLCNFVYFLLKTNWVDLSAYKATVTQNSEINDLAQNQSVSIFPGRTTKMKTWQFLWNGSGLFVSNPTCQLQLVSNHRERPVSCTSWEIRKELKTCLTRWRTFHCFGARNYVHW